MQRRRSLKDYDIFSKDKLRRDCRDFGREQRRQLLQQHRGNLSPGELQAQLQECTLHAIREKLTQPQQGPAMSNADVDDVLADLQEQIMLEIQDELAALEHQEQQDMQQVNDMAEEHMQYLQRAAAGNDTLLCPVCKNSHLVQRHGWLVCPFEGWQLNLAAESLQLSDIRTCLAAAYQEHATSGCPGQLRFGVEDLFGSQSLTCNCQQCHMLSVVL